MRAERGGGGGARPNFIKPQLENDRAFRRKGLSRLERAEFQFGLLPKERTAAGPRGLRPPNSSVTIRRRRKHVGSGGEASRDAV